ncbi:MAG: amidohydrolase family protein [Bryobacteraceae bacterium]
MRSTALIIFSGCLLLQAQNKPPKLIDSHVHHNGQKAFLDQLTAKMEALDGLTLLITAPRDIAQVKASMAEHPGRLVGLGELSLDDPHAVQLVDDFHEAGFKGLGEITQPQYSFDDRRYWGIYERAEKYGMILLFHTGIVNRTAPDVPTDASSDRMRAGTLDLIARRFPKVRIFGAHLGNPDYAWAAEIARWNPNIWWDLSGSTLIKKQNDYPSFNSIFWWSSVASAHTPKNAAHAFEKIVFGSDVFDGDLGELDRALERYHKMLDQCGIPQPAQANIFAGTVWKILQGQ